MHFKRKRKKIYSDGAHWPPQNVFKKRLPLIFTSRLEAKISTSHYVSPKWRNSRKSSRTSPWRSLRGKNLPKSSRSNYNSIGHYTNRKWRNRARPTVDSWRRRDCTTAQATVSCFYDYYFLNFWNVSLKNDTPILSPCRVWFCFLFRFVWSL